MREIRETGVPKHVGRKKEEINSKFWWETFGEAMVWKHREGHARIFFKGLGFIRSTF